MYAIELWISLFAGGDFQMEFVSIMGGLHVVTHIVLDFLVVIVLAWCPGMDNYGYAAQSGEPAGRKSKVASCPCSSFSQSALHS